MKKFYIIALVAVISAGLNAQTDVIQGGDMESADAWQVSELNSDAGSATTDFGFTDEIPTDGSGGCAHVTINGVSTGTRHQMIYQAVTIKKGSSYVFDYAIKTLNSTAMNNSWVENYIGTTQPSTDADYSTDNGSMSIGGFKSTNWQPSCTTDEGGPGDTFDGLLSQIGCIPGSTDTIVGDILLENADITEDEGTFYIGIKIGIWGADGVLEIGIDNVSLTEVGGGTAVNFSNVPSLKMYPNPATNMLTIVNGTSESVRIFNVVGQMVKEVALTSSKTNIDILALEKGIYLIQVGQSTQKVIVK